MRLWNLNRSKYDIIADILKVADPSIGTLRTHIFSKAKLSNVLYERYFKILLDSKLMVKKREQIVSGQLHDVYYSTKKGSEFLLHYKVMKDAERIIKEMTDHLNELIK